MNKVILQLWEESERGTDIRPDGCSLHIDSNERIKYIESVYSTRLGYSEIPKEYDRIVGNEIVSFIEDALFELVKQNKTIRLLQHELNNLINAEELLIKDDV